METVVVTTLGIKARQKLYWAMKKRGISLETLADYRLRNWLMDYEKREQFMDRVHQMTREGDMAFLGAAYEIGTWLIPWGKAVQGVKWIVKLAKLKKATGVLKWKKFGALEKTIEEGAGVLNELSGKFKQISESAQKMLQGGTGKVGDFILKPLGLGSTGRTVAKNLVEEVTMREAMANPQLGVRIMEGMTDSRWLGWTKMEFKIKTAEGVNAVVHYVGLWENGILKAVDDFKFK